MKIIELNAKLVGDINPEQICLTFNIICDRAI